MFKKLWGRIRKWFIHGGSTLTPKEIAMDKYNKTFSKIRSASTLAELLSARDSIRDFQQYLINKKIEYWGRQLIIDLTKYWNAKYTHWKTKTRNK